VGTLVAQTLAQMNLPYLVIEERQSIIDELRSRGIEVIPGNAAQAEMLAAANVSAARVLISAIPNPFESGNLIERARAANPDLDIIARAHSDAEVHYLRKLGANRIIMGEREIARGISDHLLRRRSGIQASAPDQAEHEAVGSPVELR
jgi:CPA2 family monovalent cation:H+ antiporter-2